MGSNSQYARATHFRTPISDGIPFEKCVASQFCIQNENDWIMGDETK